MLDELDLRDLFRFIASYPVAMVYVIAPHRAIVGASEIVVFNNFALLVDARSDRRGLQKGFRIWVLRQTLILPCQSALSSTQTSWWGGTMVPCWNFALLRCKVLVLVASDDEAQRQTCNSQASYRQRI